MTMTGAESLSKDGLEEILVAVQAANRYVSDAVDVLYESARRLEGNPNARFIKALLRDAASVCERAQMSIDEAEAGLK